MAEAGNVSVSKQDLQFNLKVKVTIHDISDLQPAYEGKPLFFVFGVRNFRMIVFEFELKV